MRRPGGVWVEDRASKARRHRARAPPEAQLDGCCSRQVSARLGGAQHSQASTRAWRKSTGSTGERRTAVEVRDREEARVVGREDGFLFAAEIFGRDCDDRPVRWRSGAVALEIGLAQRAFPAKPLPTTDQFRWPHFVPSTTSGNAIAIWAASSMLTIPAKVAVEDCRERPTRASQRVTATRWPAGGEPAMPYPGSEPARCPATSELSHARREGRTRPTSVRDYCSSRRVVASGTMWWGGPRRGRGTTACRRARER